MNSLRSLSTPCLIVDEKILLGNIRTMASFAKKNGVSLRPHFKTHKSVEIAKLQIKHGAIGITCATIDEAEALAKGGIKSVLLANQLADEGKLKRLLSLIAKSNEIIISVEDDWNLLLLDTLAAKAKKIINVLIEVDTGLARLGRRPGLDTLAFTRKVLAFKNIRFLGIMGYEGHTVFIQSREERELKACDSLALLSDTVSMLRENGIKVKIVSAGGTGTYNIAGTHAGITEIQPGSYVFMDEKYNKVLPIFKSCLFILATVLGKHADGTFIVDAGKKAISSDFGEPFAEGMQVLKMYEEHSKVKETERTGKVITGQKILLTTTHCCTTVNLYDSLYLFGRNCRLVKYEVCRQRR